MKKLLFAILLLGGTIAKSQSSGYDVYQNNQGQRANTPVYTVQPTYGGNYGVYRESQGIRQQNPDYTIEPCRNYYQEYQEPRHRVRSSDQLLQQTGQGDATPFTAQEYKVK